MINRGVEYLNENARREEDDPIYIYIYIKYIDPMQYESNLCLFENYNLLTAVDICVGSPMFMPRKKLN